MDGQAERFIQTMKNSLQKMRADPRNRKVELENLVRKFLLHYRITPHCTTEIAPSERMFNRQIRTNLTVHSPNETDKNVRDYNNTKRYRQFSVGEVVQCRNNFGKDKWKHGKISQRLGKLHYRVKLNDGRTWERHVDQILRSNDCWNDTYEEGSGNATEPGVTKDSQRDHAKEIQRPQLEEAGTPETGQGQREELPTRHRRPPTRYTDLWMKSRRK